MIDKFIFIHNFARYIEKFICSNQLISESFVKSYEVVCIRSVNCMRNIMHS